MTTKVSEEKFMSIWNEHVLDLTHYMLETLLYSQIKLRHNVNIQRKYITSFHQDEEMGLIYYYERTET